MAPVVDAAAGLHGQIAFGSGGRPPKEPHGNGVADTAQIYLGMRAGADHTLLRFAPFGWHSVPDGTVNGVA